jgi:hypothetical protein
MREALAAQLDLIEAGKMGTRDKVLRSTSADTIARLKRCIAERDAVIEGQSP